MSIFPIKSSTFLPNADKVFKQVCLYKDNIHCGDAQQCIHSQYFSSLPLSLVVQHAYYTGHQAASKSHRITNVLWQPEAVPKREEGEREKGEVMHHLFNLCSLLRGALHCCLNTASKSWSLQDERILAGRDLRMPSSSRRPAIMSKLKCQKPQHQIKVSIPASKKVV